LKRSNVCRVLGAHNLCFDRHFHLAINVQVQKLSDKVSKRKHVRPVALNQAPKNTDYQAYTCLREDLERLLTLIEAIVHRDSTEDGRCCVKLSVLLESTVPVGVAPYQKGPRARPAVRDTEFVCCHVCNDYDPRSADPARNLDDTLARITASVKAMTTGGKNCTVHAMPLAERDLIKMRDGTLKSPLELETAGRLPREAPG